MRCAETKDGVKDLTRTVKKVDRRLRDLYGDAHNLCLPFIGKQSTMTAGRLKNCRTTTDPRCQVHFLMCGALSLL